MQTTDTTPISDLQATRRWTLPALLLRVEGLALLAGAVAVYYDQGWSWLAFALLLLVPDMSMLGSVAGPRTGALVYNVIHTTALPLAVLGASLLADIPTGTQIAVVWLAHIGMDRTVGYGLKYPVSFKETHLQRV